MTDQRDPRIRALIVELAQSSAEAPTFAELEDLAAEPMGEGPVRPMGRQPSSNHGRGWLVAAAAAVAVLVLVGGVALLLQVTGPDAPVADTVVPTTLTESAPTTLAESVPTTLPDPPSSFTWSRVPHDEAVFGGARGQWMRSVTVGGPGLVAVGSVGNDGDDGDANAAVWASVDGLTWSRVPLDEAALGGARGQWMNSVTVGGPGLVAVGSDGRFAAVWTSVDGVTWSRVPHDEAVFGGADNQGMNSVTVGGPGLVAVGWVENDGEINGDGAAAVWTSVDGVTWLRVPHDEAALGGAGFQGMSSVTVGGPGLVAVGVGAGRMTVDEGHVDWEVKAAVWTSVDGVTWSRVPHDEAVFGGVGGQGMRSVTVGGPGLVAVGFDQPGDDVPSGRARDAAVWTSVDGATWSRVPHDVTLFGGTGNQRMYEVTAAGAGLVAVGADGGFYANRPDAVVWTSVDGITWSRVAHDEAVFGGTEMRSVTVAGAGLVAVGDTSSGGGPNRPIESGASVFVWVAEPDD